MSSIAKDKRIKIVFANNIIRLMNDKGKKRREMCDDLNIKYTTLCDWINGRTIPRGEQLEKLGDYFGISAGEFFIEITETNTESRQMRMDRYYSESRRLKMDVLNHMTDEQIRELLNSGFTFEHKTLEEYIIESGNTLAASSEMDWGEPVGCEIW